MSVFKKIAITKESFHFWVYYLSLCLLVISLPTSRFFITLSLILLLSNWLLQPDLIGRFRVFLGNRPAVAFSLIYLINVVGLIWTKDLHFALTNDLLHKLPTLFMPIILTSSPVLSKKRISTLLFLYIATVLMVTFIGLTIRIVNPQLDFREASPFVPHIYLGIMLLIAAFQLPLLVKQISDRKWLLLLSIAVSVWLLFFIFYIRSLSAIASLVGISLYTLFHVVIKCRSVLLKVSIVTLTSLLIGVLAWLFVDMYRLTSIKVEVDLSALPSHTNLGNSYRHDTTSYLRENGHLVHIYIADSELEKAWASRSGYDYNISDQQGHPLKQTLYRYMSSKGLAKDYKGFSELDDRDIRAVEQGLTNYLYLDWPGMYIRAHQTMMGLNIYQETFYQHSSWSTLSERLDLWRASWLAFRERPILGWGTGSLIHAVNYGLEKNNSELLGKDEKPHNQYLCTLLILGALGLFLHALLYFLFVVQTIGFRYYIFNVFIVLFAINLIANNALEGQLGQNIFVFFSLFYCFMYPKLSQE